MPAGHASETKTGGSEYKPQKTVTPAKEQRNTSDKQYDSNGWSKDYKKS